MNTRDFTDRRWTLVRVSEATHVGRRVHLHLYFEKLSILVKVIEVHPQTSLHSICNLCDASTRTSAGIAVTTP